MTEITLAAGIVCVLIIFKWLSNIEQPTRTDLTKADAIADFAEDALERGANPESVFRAVDRLVREK